MSTSVSAAVAFKAAMVAAMKTLTAGDDEVLVCFGSPGQQVLSYNNAVSFEDLTAEQSPATMGTNRAREETLTLLVAIETFRAGGDPDAEQAASDSAYALLGLLERHVRMTDTTLGGVVRDCNLTAHRSQGFTTPSEMTQGRLCVVEATFTAHVRVTG